MVWVESGYLGGRVLPLSDTCSYVESGGEVGFVEHATALFNRSGHSSAYAIHDFQVGTSISWSDATGATYGSPPSSIYQRSVMLRGWFIASSLRSAAGALVDRCGARASPAQSATSQRFLLWMRLRPTRHTGSVSGVRAGRVSERDVDVALAMIRARGYHVSVHRMTGGLTGASGLPERYVEMHAVGDDQPEVFVARVDEHGPDAEMRCACELATMIGIDLSNV